MAINYAMDIDNRAVLKAFQDLQGYLSKMNKLLEDTGKKSDDMFNSMTNGAERATGGMKELIKQAAMFGGISLGAAGMKEFGSKVIEVRKQMQSLQISFDTLLGSQEKASEMFGELKQFAATTPLMLKDLAAGAQTMLGFNIEAEKVVPTLKAIGDISMGDSQRFQSLTLAFSQMSATGKLMGQDLLQMINAGFNPLTEISAKTGKSISELKDEMSAGAISAEMVADAFVSATSEGGKFYGMLEKQGHGLSGQINQLNGAIDDMLNSIGESSEGVITDAVAGLQLLVENYDKVGRALAAIIVTYGTYKGALLAVIAVEKIQAASGAVSNFISLAKSIRSASDAMALFNLVCKANPYVLLATVLVGVVSSVIALTKNQEEYINSQERVNRLVSEYSDITDKATDSSKNLLNIIRDSNSTEWQKAKAYKDLKELCSDLTDEYDIEKIKIMNLKDAYELLEEAQYKTKMSGLTQNKEDLANMIADIDRAGGSWSNLTEATRAYLEANGLVGKQLKEVRLELQKDFEGIVEQERKLEDERSIKPQEKSEKKNKEYWEKKKKDAQNRLEALDNIQAAGREGLKIKQEIEEYNKRLTAYDSKNDSKEAEQKQKLYDLQVKQAQETARQTRQMTLMAEQARIDAMRDGTAKNIEQIKLDYAKEKEEIKLQEEKLLEQKEADARALWELQNKDKNATWANTGSKNFTAQLTKEERDALTQKDATATANYEKKIQEQHDIEKDAMQRYLSEYGTMQEKRAAITAQYQKKIDDAKNEGDKMMAQKELETAMSNLDMEALKKNVNWSMLFGDLGKYTNDQLKALEPMIKKYRQSEQYKNATEENKKVIEQAYENLESIIMEKDGIFGGLADAFTELANAEEELTKAQEAVEKATTQKEKETATENLNRATARKNNAEANARKSSETARDSISHLASTITQLGTASEISLADLGALGSQIASAFGEAGKKAGGWIAAIFTICDMVAKDGIEGLYKNVGKLLGQVIGGLVGIDVEENTRYYEEQKKLNDVYLELITDTVAKTKELMKEQAGIDAYDSYKVAEKQLNEKKELNAKNILNYLNSGASKGVFGIGSSSSEGRKARNNFYGRNLTGELSESGLRGQRLMDILGVDSLGGRLQELAYATTEQIEKMKQDADIWAHLPESVREYYKEILDANEELEDLRDTLNETLLATSFDNMQSSFKSALSNMDASAQDFADDLESIFNEAIVNSLVNDKYNDLLEDWYKSLAKMAEEADGIQNLTEQQIEAKRSEYMDLITSAKEEADLVRGKFGIDSTSGAASTTINSAMSVTEDTANEIVGRMTAMQIGNEQTRAIVQNVANILTSTLGAGSIDRGNEILDDIRTLMASNNGYLGTMVEQQTKMYKQLSSDLSRIALNTDKL